MQISDEGVGWESTAKHDTILHPLGYQLPVKMDV